MPSAVNNFKTKHLNEWVNADTAWMDMRSWDRCAEASLDLDAYAGQPCWIGLDLASKTDIAALLLVFAHTEIDGAFAVFGRYYLPEDTVQANGNSQYAGWMASNVVAHLDAQDNIYPRKERPENKIDGIVALIMAISRAITPGTSVILGADYELVVL